MFFSPLPGWIIGEEGLESTANFAWNMCNVLIHFIVNLFFSQTFVLFIINLEKKTVSHPKYQV